MHESWDADYHDLKKDIKRFEQMENGGKSYFFDVHVVENLFNFYINKFQLTKAESILQIGIHQHPQITSLKSKLAVLMIEKGENNAAVTLMEEIIKLEQSDPDTFFNLGIAYLKTKRLNDAMKCFKKALDHAYDDKEYILLDIAFNLNLETAYDEAILLLESECDNKQPDNENLLFELAFAYEEKGLFEKGEQCYRKTLNFDPFSENAWYYLGVLYIKKEEYNKAIECFDFVLALDPEFGDAILNKASCLEKLKKWEEAIDLYIEYISFDYEPILIYQYIANCYDKLKQPEMSSKFYELIVLINPGFISAWINYIVSLIEFKLKDKALFVSLNALNYHSQNEELWYLRAKALDLNGEKEKAYKAFSKAYKLNPDCLRNFIELYYLNKVLKPEIHSDIFFKKWIKKFPKSAVIHYVAAAHYIIVEGDFKKASILLNKALRIDPEYYIDLLSYFPELEDKIISNFELNKIITKNIQSRF